ncbi:MAG: Gfo/Idh/MocA family oxidoreductase [Spirochaetes bacterium]|nr:Gfo/Idh/MocA family oxidoreductase [Spirochaetota bacterium]
MKTLNVGIVGYKFMGKAHSNAWRQASVFFDPEAKPVLKVACGRHQESLKAFADRWGWEYTESDWKKMVRRDDVDIVDVSAPQYLHYDITMEALRAGKHVFCEKPLAMNVQQAREMYELAEKKGLTHYVRGPRGQDLPLAGVLPAVVDRGPDLPADLAPAEAVRGLRSPGRPQLPQRRPRALPRRRH